METVVHETMKSFQTDFFDHDKPRLTGLEFKFPAIWIVGESHTHLLALGNYKDVFYREESIRFAYIREHNPYQFYLNDRYFANDRWFLITEDALQPINREQAKSAIMDYVTPVVNAWVAENGPLPKNDRLKIKIINISIDELKALIADCRSHGNDSLMDCLKRFRLYSRSASDQYIEVSYYKYCQEFTFCEYTNGKVGLVGGIVFHGWPETGYKENGSVQLDPHYGWSIHT